MSKFTAKFSIEGKDILLNQGQDASKQAPIQSPEPVTTRMWGAVRELCSGETVLHEEMHPFYHRVAGKIEATRRESKGWHDSNPVKRIALFEIKEVDHTAYGLF